MRKLRLCVGGQLQAEIIKIQKEYEKANKLTGLKIGYKEQKILEQHFKSSVRNLEYILNKNLSAIWF